MKLNSIFTDHMVFAEKLPIRVFGSGKGSGEICFLGERVEVRSDEERWEVELQPRAAGGPFELQVKLDGVSQVIKDVYVGKVFLIAGQSNAEFPLGESNTSAELYKSDALLRNFFVTRPWIPQDVFSPDDGWMPAEKDKVAAWTALGYLAGRSVRTETGKAVGIISCYQGASVIESWLPKNVADKVRLPDGEVYIDHWYPDFAAWNANSVIYEKMLTTIMPFSVNKVVWYQGESDTTVQEAAIYDKSVAALFDCIRGHLRNSELGFVLVQIADYDHRRENDPLGWSAIQEAQERAAACDDRVTLVRSADICESSMIHPVTKNALAERIAAALTLD